MRIISIPTKQVTRARLPASLALALCAFGLLLNFPCFAAVVVDDFSTTQVLSGLGLSGAGYVSGPGILGTERDAEAYAPSIDINSSVPNQFRAFNSHPENWGTIWLTYDGVDHSTSSSFLGGLGHLDLTQGGLNDRFRIALTAATIGGGSLSISVRNVNWFGSALTVTLPAAPAVLDLRFADFHVADLAHQLVDFADVGFLQISLAMNPGEAYTFGPIVATVPEPAASTLIPLAAAGILALRRRC